MDEVIYDGKLKIYSFANEEVKMLNLSNVARKDIHADVNPNYWLL